MDLQKTFFFYLIGGDIYNAHNGYESFDLLSGPAANRDDPDINLIPEHASDANNVEQIGWEGVYLAELHREQAV